MSTPVFLRIASVANMAGQAAAAGRDWLSPSEQARLTRITAPDRRAQFLAARWALRQLLAEHHGGDVLHDWMLTASENAPPGLQQRGHGRPAYLAISHSHAWLACGASSVPIGVDVEALKRTRDVSRLASEVCTPAERQRLQALGDDAAQVHFHVIWTLKEAWLKQRSEALSLDKLQRIETQPSNAAGANARTWLAPGVALSLVAPCDVYLPGFALDGQPPGTQHPQWWHVTPCMQPSAGD